MKYKAFFIIFKGLSMKQTMQIFSEGESPTLIENFIFCAVQAYKEGPEDLNQIENKVQDQRYWLCPIAHSIQWSDPEVAIPRCSTKQLFLKVSQKFLVKRQYQSLFFNEAADVFFEIFEVFQNFCNRTLPRDSFCIQLPVTRSSLRSGR